MRRRWQNLIALMICCMVGAGLGAFATNEVDARVDEIDALMHAYEEAGTFIGTVLVAEAGEVIYAHAIGYADRDWEIWNTVDTRYRIASISKTFTKVLVLQLVEDGLLKLEGTIADYLPDYTGPGADRITVQQLFDHRSGIVNESAVENLDRIERDFYTRSQMFDLIASYPLAASPGQRWIYSNFGYYLLGAILESASGRTYNELLQERICTPAGMRDTLPDATTQIIERRASGYSLDGTGVLTLDVPLDMSFVFGYGHLLSTTHDLYLFYQALLDGMLLEEPYRRVVYDDEGEILPIGDGSRYVYAVEDGPASINGFRAGINSYPNEDRFIVVLMNTRGPGAEYVFDVGRNLAAILYGAPYEGPNIP